MICDYDNSDDDDNSHIECNIMTNDSPFFDLFNKIPDMAYNLSCNGSVDSTAV